MVDSAVIEVAETAEGFPEIVEYLFEGEFINKYDRQVIESAITDVGIIYDKLPPILYPDMIEKWESTNWTIITREELDELHCPYCGAGFKITCSGGGYQSMWVNCSTHECNHLACHMDGLTNNPPWVDDPINGIEIVTLPAPALR